MARKKQRFRVSRFVNPSGSVAWRVSGSLNGRRVRQNFDDRIEADRRAAALEIEAMAADAAVCSRLTRLSAQQLHAAELLFDRAGGDVDRVLGLLPLVRPVKRIGLLPAKAAWLTDLERSGCRDVTVSVNGYAIGAFFQCLEAEFVDQISQAAVEAFVFAPAKAMSRADRRKRVGQFLRFCQAQGWRADNPAERIGRIKAERGLPAILSAEQVKALLAQVAGKPLELYALLACFTGLRPTEARQIRKGLVHTAGGLACVEVSAQVAKVSQCRQVELIPEVRDRISKVGGRSRVWKKGAVFFNAFAWKKAREDAGLLELWENDILRHTYASWHYALFKDVTRLTYAMGNSKDVLFRNYVRPMTEAAAREYLDALG